MDMGKGNLDGRCIILIHKGKKHPSIGQKKIEKVPFYPYGR